MKRKNRRDGILRCGAAAGVALAAAAAAHAQGDGVNLALGKTARFDPRPDYAYCTDAEDARQLTDGVRTKGYFWTQKSTIGWNHARPALITIDLGRVEPIAGVSYNTAAGVAGVRWPDAVFVLVSDDGRAYREAGELVTGAVGGGAPPATGYAVHCFRRDDFHTRGRFVCLAVAAQGFAFVDEIEIRRGDPAWLAEPAAGEAHASPREFFAASMARQSVLRRMVEDARAVRALLSQSVVPEAARPPIAAELDAAAGAFAEAARVPLQPGFRAILPLNESHARVFRAQAAAWRAAGLPPLTCWQNNPWDPLPLTGLPPRDAPAAVRLAMLRNEYRAAAFNLSNATGRDLDLRLRFDGLPGATNGGWIAVHEVQWTDTASGQPVAAALPEAPWRGDGFAIRACAGLTRQVWLTFHPPAGLAPGTLRGRIVIEGGPAAAAVPVELRLHAARFPDRPTLHVGGWDYTDRDSGRDVTSSNRAAVIAHLRDRFVDSPWATAAVLPYGSYDAEGRMKTPPDTAAFDEWLRLWPGARQYCVFASVGNSCAGLAAGTPAFEAAVGGWARFWADHVRRRGLEPAQLAVLLVDEPHRAEQDRTILAWARPIRAAATGLRVWEDPTHDDPTKADPEMLAACDVLCPNRPMYLSRPAYRAYYPERRPPSTELAFYSCSGPARLLDPYAYHRLQAWTAWQNGARSSFFWSFTDSGGGSSWNEYTARGSSYVPFFLDAGSVTAGKHMEAIRESAEDFECLVMLRDAVAAAEKRGGADPEVEKARALLAGAAGRVCGAPGADRLQWSEEKDRGVADRVREELLDALDRL